jgi:hypothetical protein
MTNLEFLRKHARPGRVGLFGGSSVVNRGIRRAQALIDPEGRRSLWSHAAVFEGKRTDGRHWLIESDFELRKRTLRNGVQESRIEKYGDAAEWPNLAVLDFRLSPSQVRKLLTSGLDQLAAGTPYALGGLLQTGMAMLRMRLDRGTAGASVFCSAFVRAVFLSAGVDLAPGIAVPHTAPDHLHRTPRPHRRWERVRDPVR